MTWPSCPSSLRTASSQPSSSSASQPPSPRDPRRRTEERCTEIIIIQIILGAIERVDINPQSLSSYISIFHLICDIFCPLGFRNKGVTGSPIPGAGLGEPYRHPSPIYLQLTMCWPSLMSQEMFFCESFEIFPRNFFSLWRRISSMNVEILTLTRFSVQFIKICIEGDVNCRSSDRGLRLAPPGAWVSPVSL